MVTQLQPLPIYDAACEEASYELCYATIAVPFRDSPAILLNRPAILASRVSLRVFTSILVPIERRIIVRGLEEGSGGGGGGSV